LVRGRVRASLNFMYVVLLSELHVNSFVLMVQYGAAIWCRSANKQILQCVYSHTGVSIMTVFL